MVSEKMGGSINTIKKKKKNLGKVDPSLTQTLSGIHQKY